MVCVSWLDALSSQPTDETPTTRTTINRNRKIYYATLPPLDTTAVAAAGLASNPFRPLPRTRGLVGWIVDTDGDDPLGFFLDAFPPPAAP